jgi:ribonuclease Z
MRHAFISTGLPLRPLLHPSLVNGRFGDPAVYVEHLFERHALLLDLGDITTLPARMINRIDKVFVSHTHIDHFIGFDHLLRVLVGRDKAVSLYGPTGLIDGIDRKLHAYAWNLAQRYENDLAFLVTEVDPSLAARTVRFRLRDRFAAETIASRHLDGGVLCADAALKVTAATLDHRMPCLGFALAETAHLNVWNTRLAERGLPVGAWLTELKHAVIAGQPDDTRLKIRERASGPVLREMPLAALRDVLTVTPGQKIGYVTDAADTPANRAAIIALVEGADILFIESAFAAGDAALAAERAHLTTRAAGEIARAAGVKRVEPFHFSARYEGEEPHAGRGRGAFRGA